MGFALSVLPHTDTRIYSHDLTDSSFLLQTLLQNNASAAFLNAQLSETEWRVSDVSAFLSKVAEDRRPAGSAYTWRDVFNETNQAIQTISRFMEVSVLYADMAAKIKCSLVKLNDSRAQWVFIVGHNVRAKPQ